MPSHDLELQNVSVCHTRRTLYYRQTPVKESKSTKGLLCESNLIKCLKSFLQMERSNPFLGHLSRRESVNEQWNWRSMLDSLDKSVIMRDSSPGRWKHPFSTCSTHIQLTSNQPCFWKEITHHLDEGKGRPWQRQERTPAGLMCAARTLRGVRLSGRYELRLPFDQLAAQLSVPPGYHYFIWTMFSSARSLLCFFCTTQARPKSALTHHLAPSVSGEYLSQPAKIRKLNMTFFSLHLLSVGKIIKIIIQTRHIAIRMVPYYTLLSSQLTSDSTCDHKS
jgi:hypothetical protein